MRFSSHTRTIRSNFQNGYICLRLYVHVEELFVRYFDAVARGGEGIAFSFDENIRDPKTKMAHSSTVLDNLVKVNRVSFVKFVLLFVQHQTGNLPPSCSYKFHQLSQLSWLLFFSVLFSVFDLIFGQKISRL